MPDFFARPCHRVKKVAYKSSVNLQLSHLYQQTGSTDAALECASKAFESCTELVKMCASACEEHLSRHFKFNQSPRLKQRIKAQKQYNLMNSPHYLQYHDLVESTQPILENLLCGIEGGMPKKSDHFNSQEFLDTKSDFFFGVKWLSLIHI